MRGGPAWVTKGRCGRFRNRLFPERKPGGATSPTIRSRLVEEHGGKDWCIYCAEGPSSVTVKPSGLRVMPTAPLQCLATREP